MRMLIVATIIALASFYAGRYFRKHNIGVKTKPDELPPIEAEIIREQMREKPSEKR
ncbi:MAG: hypothetical protein ACT4NX_00910 [Deltaproteobacteria bacterium]